MKRIVISCLCIAFGQMCADSFVVDTPLGFQSSLQENEVAPQLRGIVFLNGWDHVCKECKQSVSGVVADGVSFLKQHPDFLQTLQETYVGKPLTQEALWNLKCDLMDFYRKNGQPFAAVGIPHQDMQKQVLQVVVQEAVFGAVITQGNKYISADRLRQSIQLQPGQPIDTQTFVRDLARLNQTPFRRTDAVFRPSKKPGIVDVLLTTIDRWPYRFYTGADNTGTIATDRDRLFFGLNLGKTIVEDTEISYQFTCAPNWNRFNAQTALFRIPFPARQTCIFYGGYSQVQPELSNEDSEKSISWQVDGRYRIPLITNTAFLQELIVGYDFKQVDSRVKTDGVSVFHGIADTNQFMLGYDLGLRNPSYRMTLVAEVYGSPGGITKYNKTSAYQAFRYGAKAAYVYGKLSHAFAYRFHHWWVSYDIQGQLSSANLLPSEQFTLAGYHAVRGFEERCVIADQALLVQLCLQTPHLSIGRLCGLSKKDVDELYGLVFFDYGLGGNRLFYSTENKTMYLASIGPGLRYQIDRYVTARFDYGVQLFHHGFENPTHSRYNFGLIVAF